MGSHSNKNMAWPFFAFCFYKTAPVAQSNKTFRFNSIPIFILMFLNIPVYIQYLFFLFISISCVLYANVLKSIHFVS